MVRKNEQSALDKLEGAIETIQHLFKNRLPTTPGAVAVRHGENKLTYQQLDNQSDILARQILIISPESLFVGISTTRRLNMIVGILAILKSGKSYLPLDPAYPTERLTQMIGDSSLDLCLSPDSESNLFYSLGLKTLEEGSDSGTADFELKYGTRAYVLYTSGSTGKPKGVSMVQAALVNLLHWQEKNSFASAGTKTLQFAPLSFDVSFQEIFSTLTTGGELILIDDDLRLDPLRLIHFIESESIHRIFVPFVALQYLTEAADANHVYPKSLREIITAGEQLKITRQLIHFFKSLPDSKLINQYGPTECHVVSSLELTGDPDLWPALPSIGKPIDHCSIFILDENLQLVNDGNIGELCIAGVCLAEGYLNRPQLTEEKFINWMHPANGAMRIYRTGDLAKYNPEGNVEFLGRRDDQVKIRGYRVEPGEIEILLSAQTDIRHAVVIAREDKPGQLRLVAYLVSATGKKDTRVLRNKLKEFVPDYMIPAAFIWMDEFPKTSSGKVDRKSLPRPEIKRPELGVSYKAPVTKTEKILASLWADLLQLDSVGTEDHFFELGGNSLLAVKTVAELQLKHRLKLPVTKLYQFPTIAGIVRYLEGDITIQKKQRKHSSFNQHEDIAVVSMAGRFPGADTTEELWDNLKNGKESISFFSLQELDPSIPDGLKNDPDYVAARGVIRNAENFDASFFGINTKLADLMDPQQRIFLEIAWEALEKAGSLPQNYKGSIGVFAGTGNNSYYLNNVLKHPELVETMGAFQVMTHNEKDYVASRTAFAMDLKGPAISIHTACSTSLLAIAQAVDSLRNGQCDMAIAGGASVTAPLKSGHLYQDGAMLSRDGHCRPFDADATGTVFSDGAGAVVLKTRSAAERDGDRIWALIKGVGINNDGGGKGSFTAPSAEGQAGAISMAIDDAGIEASDIGYIEAHGTATPLGDPIEIEGLSMAFGKQDKNQFCAIGSIKSNLGHLTAAAGVAGFIKTAFALHFRELPPSLHYEKANPHIGFEQTPFFVNHRLRKWNSETVRRAGVSSFGVGGTNVHLILEEYVDQPRVSDKGRPFQMINWSAKTSFSLDAYAKKLESFVQQNPDLNISDLAFSLQTSRAEFKQRRFAIASDAASLAEKLRSTSLPGESIRLDEISGDPVFVFPGQGSQYVNMGLELYQSEPVFREAVDECAHLLQAEMKEDIRNIIFPANADEKAIHDINNTFYTQPALFVIEYALARLWMNWGIHPSAFVGHSIGEFVGAHLAGVFSLADGLKLVAARGKLMSELEPGTMLSVRAPYQTILALIPEDISLAAVNSPNLSVVAGPGEAIHQFSKTLQDKNIPNKILHTSHAFHSAMMDPIIAPFLKIVETVSLHAPQVPVFSTVTGKYMTEQEAKDPGYWAGHLRNTVKFSAAVLEAMDQGFSTFLESGPRNVASTLIRQQGHVKTPRVVSSLEALSSQSDYESILKAAGQLWLYGLPLDWHAFYAGQQRQRMDLPTYAFEQTKHWVDPGPFTVTVTSSNAYHPQIDPGSEIPDLQTSPMRKSQLIEKLKFILEEASGIEMAQADPKASFIEMGLDSLLLTQVSLLIKKEFSVPVTFRQLNENCGSLELLADYLDEKMPADIKSGQPSTVNRQPSSVNPQQPADSAMNLISQQIQLLAQQVAMLSGGTSGSLPSTVNRQPSASGSQHDVSAEELAELKKPFGATAKIEKQTTNLSDKQKQFLERFTLEYNRKTAASKKYTQQHRDYMSDPRVVTGFKPATKEIVYPLVVNRSKGSRIWDLDGNEYVDVLNGFGSNFFGYSPKFVTDAIKAQIDAGYELGPQHELAGPVCKLICAFTGSDRAALCNTGSEAVLGAMRIARTVTGRSLIVAFSGSYHGINDEVIVRGTKKLKTFPAAPGIMINSVQNMLILDYGTEESLRIIKERSDEIAAVLVEPVQSRRPEFQPVEFLKELRKITSQSGTALVFDEVITGFRMHPGGMQAMFGISADIGTYGKVVAAGMPFGVIAGKKLWMDALDGGTWQFGNDSSPEAGVTYFAGTFVRHPLALAAAKAALEYMKMKGPSLQEGINRNTKKLADGLNEICSKNGLPLYVAQFGSLWKFKWKNEIPYGDLVFTLLRNRGVHIWDGFPCFLTEAHTEADIQFVISKFEACIGDLIESGFMKSEPPSDVINEVQEQPPVQGARLGRDPQGNPAWFISDPNRPGKYKQLNVK